MSGCVKLVEASLGNVGDREWSERLSAVKLDRLDVDQWEAQKSRFKKTTANGTEVAISLNRGTYLRDGDILAFDAEAGTAIVARISMREVMIVYLDDLARSTPEIAMRTCVELGHAMGNQHWPAVVKGNRIYVPLTVDRKVMASVMDTHRFEGIRYEFVSGGEVVFYLAPHESRRLFGGAEGPVHTHTDDSYSVTDAETRRVYGRPPVRAHTHARTDDHTQASPPDPIDGNATRK